MFWPGLGPKALVFVLVLEFSGLSGLVRAQASQAPAPLTSATVEAQKSQAEEARARAIDARARALRDGLSALAFKARNPGTLSVGKVSDTDLRSELERLKAQFADWKAEIEADLAQPRPALDLAVLEIVFHFDQLSKLLDIEAALASRSSAATALSELSQRYALRIPAALLGQLSGFDEVPGFAEVEKVRQMLQDPSSAIATRFTGSGTAELSLGESFLRTLRIGAGTRYPDEKSFLLLSKYLAFLALHKHWLELQALRPVGRGGEPLAVPEKLQAELRPLLGEFSADFGERSAQVLKDQEPAFRQTLVQELHIWLSRGAGVPAFATPEFGARVAKAILGQEGEVDASALQGLLSAMRAQETKLQAELFAKHLEAYPLPLVELPEAEVLAIIKKALAKAKLHAAAPLLQGVEIPKERWEAVVKTVEAEVDAYPRRVPDSALLPRLRKAREASAAAGPSAQRKAYIDRLVAKARLLAREESQLESAEIDLAALFRALRPDLEAQGLRPTSQELIGLIIGAPTRAQAAWAYQKVLDDLSRRQAAASDVKAETERDLRVVSEWGRLSGLAEPPRATLRDLPLSSSQKKRYRQVVENQLLGQPILSVTTTSDGKPLHALIAEADARGDAAGIEALVEQGLVRLESQIRRSAEELGKIRDLRELALFSARSKLMTQLIGEGFPGYAPYQRQLVELATASIEERGSLRRVSDAYMSPMLYLMPLFLTDLVLVFFRPTAPFVMAINRFRASFMPHVAGYMLLAIPGIFADLGYSVAEVRDFREQHGRLEGYFYTTAMEQSFYDYFDLMESSDRVKATELNLMVFGASQVVFLGSPVLAQAGKRFLLRSMDRWRASQFRTLGFEGRQYPWDEAAIQAQAEREVARIETQERAPEERKARVRQVRSAETKLLNSLAKQRQKAERIRQDLRSQFSALGLAEDAATFSLDELDAALAKVRARQVRGEASLLELGRALRAHAEILAYMRNEWSFAQPGLLHQWARGWRAKVTGAEREYTSAATEVRQAMLSQVYGFSWRTRRGEASSRIHVNRDKDLYGILGVTPQASAEEIKRAYRKLAMKYHPDRNPGNPLAEQKFVEIKEAYEILSDPAQRAEYDGRAP